MAKEDNLPRRKACENPQRRRLLIRVGDSCLQMPQRLQQLGPCGAESVEIVAAETALDHPEALNECLERRRRRQWIIECIASSSD